MKRLFCAILAFVLACCLSGSVFAAEAPEISAPAGILMEVQSGRILFEKNVHEVRECAALSSMMTLLLAFEAIDRGELSLSEPLPASPEAANASGQGVWIRAGEALSCEELIRASAMVSAPDAQAVLEEALGGSGFSQLAKRRAQELSIQTGAFEMDSSEAPAAASAFALCTLARALCLEGRVFDYTGSRVSAIRGGETQLVSANSMLKTYPGTNGLKTASSDAAGCCAAISAKRGELTLLCVILGAKTSEDRFRDAQTLLDYGFENYCFAEPQIPELPEIPVENGMQKTARLTLSAALAPVLCEKGKEGSLSVSFLLPEKAQAPLKNGDRAGAIQILLGKEVVEETELLYAQSVEEIGFSQVLRVLWEIFLTL